MKTVKILLSLVVVAGVLLTSCKKDDEPTPSTPTKATVTGYVYADLDLTEAGFEYAPSGTKIMAWVDTEELFVNPNPALTYPKKFYEATVGADGKYSLSIEVGNNPVTVNIEPGDFWFNQQVTIDDVEVKKYSMVPVSIDVLNNQTKILDLVFF